MRFLLSLLGGLLITIAVFLFMQNLIKSGQQEDIVLPLRSGEPLRFNGEDYLRHFVLPNFFFHSTTTYALLRHAGVDIGKHITRQVKAERQILGGSLIRDALIHSRIVVDRRDVNLQGVI